jgi:hypothetical protein
MEQVSYDEYRGATKLANMLIKSNPLLRKEVGFFMRKLHQGLDLWAEEMEKAFKND